MFVSPCFLFIFFILSSLALSFGVIQLGSLLLIVTVLMGKEVVTRLQSVLSKVSAAASASDICRI